MAESEEEINAAERREQLEHIEGAVRAQLEQRDAIQFWETARDKLHCERFVKSRTGSRLLSTLMNQVLAAQTVWRESENPTSPECIVAHKSARIAMLAIAAIDEILVSGAEAEAELRKIDIDLGEPDAERS